MPDSFFSAHTSRKRKRSTTHESGSVKKVAWTAKGRTAVKGSTLGKKKARVVDEELESDATREDGGVDDMDLRAKEVDPNESEDEDEDETPAEKRLRLAKLYLESMKEGLGVSQVPVPRYDVLNSCVLSADGEYDAADVDKELLSARLKQDVMEHAGKVHLFVADTVGDRVHHTPRASITTHFAVRF